MKHRSHLGRVAMVITFAASLAGSAFAQSDDGPAARPAPPAAGGQPRVLPPQGPGPEGGPGAGRGPGGPGPQRGPGGPGPSAGPGPGERHHRDRGGNGVGAAIGAGVVGGIVGGALLGGQRPGPGYDPGYAPPPPPPPPVVYDEDDDEPACRIVRRPVYDEDGDIVRYRTRRICR